MDTNKRVMLFKCFVSPQFSYCPLTCMFHSRKMEYRTKSIYKSSLKLVYEDSHDLKDKLVSVG